MLSDQQPASGRRKSPDIAMLLLPFALTAVVVLSCYQIVRMIPEDKYSPAPKAGGSAVSTEPSQLNSELASTVEILRGLSAQHKVQQAAIVAHRAIQKCLANKKEFDAAVVQTMLGTVYSDNGRFHDAERFWYEARMPIFKEMQTTGSIESLMWAEALIVELSNSYLCNHEQKQLADLCSQWLKAANGKESQLSNYRVASVYNFYGDAVRQSDTKLAEDNYRKAMDLCGQKLGGKDRMRFAALISHASRGMAALYLARNLPELALTWAETAHKDGMAAGSAVAVALADELLAECYARLNEGQRAENALAAAQQMVPQLREDQRKAAQLIYADVLTTAGKTQYR